MGDGDTKDAGRTKPEGAPVTTVRFSEPGGVSPTDRPAVVAGVKKEFGEEGRSYIIKRVVYSCGRPVHPGVARVVVGERQWEHHARGRQEPTQADAMQRSVAGSDAARPDETDSTVSGATKQSGPEFSDSASCRRRKRKPAIPLAERFSFFHRIVVHRKNL